MLYCVHSAKVKCDRWYPTKAEAIAAFERKRKRAGIAPPLKYPPSVSGDADLEERHRLPALDLCCW